VLLSIKSDTLTRVDRYSTRVNKTRDMVMEEAAEYYLDTHEQTD
jgi:predicted transcriptional regulator